MPTLQKHIFEIVLAGVVAWAGGGVDAAKVRPQRAETRQQTSRSVTKLPFELRGNMIFLPVRVNGSKPLAFGLDTGAYLSVINTSVAEQLGLKTGRSGIGLGAAGQVVSVSLPDVDLDINGAMLNDLNVSSMALSSLENTLGQAMDGILGAEFFRRYVVEIDYEKKEIAVFEPADFTYTGRGERLPLTFYHNHPYVRARVSLPGTSAIEGEFVIDAGSNFPVILLPSFVERNNLGKSLPPTLTTFARAVGGEIRMPLGRANTLELGGLKLERPVTAFPPSGWFAEQTKAGNIGGAVLRRFKVIFDYSRARVILEPNKYFSEPFEHDMSGLSLVSESPAFKVVRVNRVLAQSPAEEAGIKPGDEIVSVDGRLAASLKLVSLRELLRRPGKVFSLKIKRETDMITVKLRTRRLI